MCNLHINSSPACRIPLPGPAPRRGRAARNHETEVLRGLVIRLSGWGERSRCTRLGAPRLQQSMYYTGYLYICVLVEVYFYTRLLFLTTLMLPTYLYFNSNFK